MNILLIGPRGQVGSALRETLRDVGTVVPAERTRLDLANPETARTTVRAMRPDVIVNAAAYTAVDKAETEEALATLINGEAPAVLADEAKRLGALLVHFSTDYVFDGRKTSSYVESDVPNPLNAYGRSKHCGEKAVSSSGCRHLIFRTSWVYAEAGRNFLLAILRLAKERKTLQVVDDQVGAPTSNLMIARATAAAIARAASDASVNGLYHMSAGGTTSWCGFAGAILRASGLETEVTPVSTEQYGAAAPRPRNSALDNSKLTRDFQIALPDWKTGMKEVLSRVVMLPG